MISIENRNTLSKTVQKLVEPSKINVIDFNDSSGVYYNITSSYFKYEFIISTAFSIASFLGS
jgi:hypothetical protein